MPGSGWPTLAWEDAFPSASAAGPTFRDRKGMGMQPSSPSLRLPIRQIEMAMPDYVLNLWYMAGWAAEFPEGSTLSRTLLDRPWLIWRTQGGEPVIMADRCRTASRRSAGARGWATRSAAGITDLALTRAGAAFIRPFPASRQRRTLRRCRLSSGTGHCGSG